MVCRVRAIYSSVAVEGIEPNVRSRLTTGLIALPPRCVIAPPGAPRRDREKIFCARVWKPQKALAVSFTGKMPFPRRTTRVSGSCWSRTNLFACRASTVERKECSRWSRTITRAVPSVPELTAAKFFRVRVEKPRIDFRLSLDEKCRTRGARPVGVERTGLEPVIFACRASTVGRET